LERLLPGLTEADLRKIFDNFDIPDDVHSLYSWKGGTERQNSTIGECWLFKMGALIEPEKAIRYYQNFVNKDEYWIDNMFPLFESGGGDFYLLDIDKHRRTRGLVFYYSRPAVDFKVIISKYDSLECLFKSILECFSNGAYSYNYGTKRLEFDLQLERQINVKNNPNSKYWKLFK
jgi:hypothetical protein